MIRSLDSCAAGKDKDAVHRTIPARTVKLPRNTCLCVICVIFVILSTTGNSPEAVRQETDRLSGDQAVTGRYFTVAPDTNAFNVNQSGSCCEANCWPPP